LHASSSVHLRLLALVVLATTASGCAALALPAVGMSMMGDAAGGVAKAGVERTMSGAMYRTFSAPLAEMRDAVRRSFRDLEIQIIEDDLLIGGGAKIRGEALHRHITVRLEPVTPALTRLKLVDGLRAHRADGPRPRRDQARRRRFSTSSLTRAASAAGSTGLVT